MELYVLTTGGTFDKVYFDALSDYRIGGPQIKGILKRARVSLKYCVREVVRKDSLDMVQDDRLALLSCIKNTSCARFLIIHGTDTMIQTAQFLLPCATRKTIVLTGSMQPARFVDSDAAFNAGFAVASSQILSKGVYLAMSGKIFKPFEVRKNSQRGIFEKPTTSV